MARECAACDFSGSDEEFMAVGGDVDGALVICHRDDASAGMVLCCVGCVTMLGHVEPDIITRLVRYLVARRIAEAVRAA